MRFDGSASSTRCIGHEIFKYAVWSTNAFSHFMNSSVAEFYDSMPLVMSTQYGDRDDYFYRDI